MPILQSGIFRNEGKIKLYIQKWMEYRGILKVI
jgi:hypothetical protein